MKRHGCWVAPGVDDVAQSGCQLRVQARHDLGAPRAGSEQLCGTAVFASRFVATPAHQTVECVAAALGENLTVPAAAGQHRGRAQARRDGCRWPAQRCGRPGRVAGGDGRDRWAPIDGRAIVGGDGLQVGRGGAVPSADPHARPHPPGCAACQRTLGAPRPHRAGEAFGQCLTAVASLEPSLRISLACQRPRRRWGRGVGHREPSASGLS